MVELFGHVTQLSPNSIPQKTFNQRIVGGRGKVTPHKRWGEEITEP